jgi:hypothetical protein
MISIISILSKISILYLPVINIVCRLAAAVGGIQHRDLYHPVALIAGTDGAPIILLSLARSRKGGIGIGFM